MRGSKNPQAMLTQMANTNPDIKRVMDLVNQNGGNAQQVFYQMAKEKGVDPESILSQLR